MSNSQPDNQEASTTTPPNEASAAVNPDTQAAQFPPQVLAALAAARQPLPYAPQQMMLPGLIAQQTMQVWQGQFPPPDAIERYEAVLPGCFDRLIKMAETQAATQARETENAQVFAKNDTRRGHWLGFAAMVLGMLGALVCVYKSAPGIAVAFLTVPVMGVAKALVDSVSGIKKS